MSRSAQLVAHDLQARGGYTSWISHWEDDVDLEAMQRGVDRADALILIMTPGIFHKDRK